MAVFEELEVGDINVQRSANIKTLVLGGDPLNGTAGTTIIATGAQLNTAALGGPTTAITDPGDAGAIPVTSSGYVPLVSAGAETRTLAAPTFIGQALSAYFKTDGGDCVVTCATAVNQTGNNTLTFADAGDQIVLMAVESGANLRWRVQSNDGVALSTV